MRDPKNELIGRKKMDLDTPCLTLDLDLLDENLQKMQARVKAAGKALRPHAKTHKCSTLAKMQVANGAIGGCAAKVSEAEVLVDAGISGILITGPVAGRGKVYRLVSLLGRAPFLMAVVDHPVGIESLESRLAEKSRQPGSQPAAGTRAGRGDHRMLETEFRDESLRIAQTLKAHCDRKGVALSHFASAWELASQAVSAVIAGPRTLAQWQDYFGALDCVIDAADEALVDSLVTPGHASTPGYNDPAYPLEAR